ncbi:ferritin-like fold-containing protein [Modestobacter italicus]|uniref:ferritin-like fold-containing protein n=1 Tax=Modestobacter italicus (strain DSM 44449 / CECT 9708 / BC 501) TaxID=2732864 RepID=UPI001C9390D9|nr:ferritin-like fold-containing protein [Modestobacter italicus]
MASAEDRAEGGPTAQAGEGPGRQAVVALLGVLSYAELTAFDRLAEDARLAPTLDGRAALARMAAAEIGHHERLTARLRELGVDVAEAMGPYVAALDAFHDGTRASTWLEGLVKAYVGDGLATDFYREVAAFLPQPDRALVEEVLADTGHADFALREVRAAIVADPTLAGRLALWARRLVGEALTQSQAVIAEHDELADLIIGGTGDLAGVAQLLQRLTTAHSARMQALGLNG